MQYTIWFIDVDDKMSIHREEIDYVSSKKDAKTIADIRCNELNKYSDNPRAFKFRVMGIVGVIAATNTKMAREEPNAS